MITLNNGKKIPKLGLGTHKMVNPTNVIYESIKNGCRLIDKVIKVLDMEMRKKLEKV